MKKITFGPDQAQHISQFNSINAASHCLGSGQGQTHVHFLHFEPHSEIGPHVAGFDQLFLVISGNGWAAGPTGEKTALTAGEGVQFSKGEMHSKGSETGMAVLMVQVSHLNAEHTEA